MRELLELQTDMLRQIAMGGDLASFADALCRRAESLVEGVICSILRMDEKDLLHPLASPSLPIQYSGALRGLPIGPVAGSCGTAAYRREEVIVTDIATDPLWEIPRVLALPLGLKACWSSPILDESGRTLATFAFYYRTCRGPNAIERRIVETCVDLCAIAIRHHNTQDRISRMAYTDALTGLPNRVAFERFATAALGGGERTIAIHYIDLDEFKAVNDTLGHRAGDLLLSEVGKRLSRAVGADVFLARLGGDEFVLCLTDADPEAQEAIAKAVLAALTAPVEIAGQAVRTAASIGIALAPDHGRSLDELMRNADIALYRAKAEGRNTYRAFSEELVEALRETQRLKADLRQAIENDGFHIVYQPIMDMRTRTILSFEALLRWRHLERGPIGPDHFIPLAEESGLIGAVGLWVLRHATREAAIWSSEIALAINVSPLQLKQSDFAFEVARALRDSGLSPARLVLEVTETALFDNDAMTRQTLAELKSLGIVIALDDFGTGYSSLALIQDRRFRKLKIDKSFVDGIGKCRDSEAIVKGTIEIARQMGFRTVAEGIEHVEQLAWLEAHGCDEAQGYLISRPMPPQDVAGFVAPDEADRTARSLLG